MYDERLGQWHFWCSLVSVNVLFSPCIFVGLAGMPRRIPDYALQFADFNMLISLWRLLPSGCHNCCSSGGDQVHQGNRRAIGYGRGGRGWSGPAIPRPYHSFKTPPDMGPEERVRRPYGPDQSRPLLRKLALVVLAMFGFAFALVPSMTSSAGSPVSMARPTTGQPRRSGRCPTARGAYRSSFLPMRMPGCPGSSAVKRCGCRCDRGK